VNPNLYEVVLAAGLLLAAALLVAWYLRYKAARSESRMMSMLQRIGLDPELAAQADTETVISEIRRRCRKCQAEDVCERWLEGKLEGSNSFCPNRRVFEELAKRPKAA
jgi:hypothetical protein